MREESLYVYDESSLCFRQMELRVVDGREAKNVFNNTHLFWRSSERLVGVKDCGVMERPDYVYWLTLL